VKKPANDAAVAKKAADDAVVVKKAADEAAAVKMATDGAAIAKKAVDDVATVGFGSSSAPSTGAKRAVVPSGDFSAPGSLSMLHKPSFAISCTTSMILIWFYWCIVCHPSTGRPLLGGSSIAGAPKAGGP
jgi:hypothetical protein